MKRSNLDEMQEQKLLKIEHVGCWLAFWGLLAAMAIQALIGQGTAVFGEWIVFMVLALYLGISCVRAGIWDRRLQMNTKTNLLLSMIAALCAGGFFGLFLYLRYQAIHGALAAGGIMAGVTFALCMIALTIAMKATQKRLEKLNEEPGED